MSRFEVVPAIPPTDVVLLFNLPQIQFVASNRTSALGSSSALKESVKLSGHSDDSPSTESPSGDGLPLALLAPAAACHPMASLEAEEAGKKEKGEEEEEEEDDDDEEHVQSDCLRQRRRRRRRRGRRGLHRRCYRRSPGPSGRRCWPEKRESLDECDGGEGADMSGLEAGVNAEESGDELVETEASISTDSDASSLQTSRPRKRLRACDRDQTSPETAAVTATGRLADESTAGRRRSSRRHSRRGPFDSTGGELLLHRFLMSAAADSVGGRGSTAAATAAASAVANLLQQTVAATTALALPSLAAMNAAGDAASARVGVPPAGLVGQLLAYCLAGRAGFDETQPKPTSSAGPAASATLASSAPAATACASSSFGPRPAAPPFSGLPVAISTAATTTPRHLQPTSTHDHRPGGHFLCPIGQPSPLPP
ncbi:unnamed protein product, partial [Protopolystoma xenopodis]